MGDAMVPYLVRGSGEGVALDAFAAASRDNRWLVVVRGGTLVLIDDVSGVERVLPDADVRGEASGSRAVAAFDSLDEHVVYARLVHGSSRVAIRALATQTERELNLNGDTVWQVQREPGSTWIWLPRIRADISQRAGSWPRLVTTAFAGDSCRGVDANSLGMLTNAIASAWLHADTGELRADRPGSDDGRTMLTLLGIHASPRPRSYELVSAACDNCEVAMGPLHWALVEPATSATGDGRRGATFMTLR